MRELDFGDYNDKLSKSGREVLALAIEESRRRDQNYLAAEHLFLALVKIEKRLFEDIVRDMRLSADDIIKDISQHLDLSKQYVGKGLKITFSMKSIFRLAWINTFQCGRSTSIADFFAARSLSFRSVRRANDFAGDVPCAATAQPGDFFTTRSSDSCRASRHLVEQAVGVV